LGGRFYGGVASGGAVTQRDLGLPGFTRSFEESPGLFREFRGEFRRKFFREFFREFF
jgi:hypothetical protein